MRTILFSAALCLIANLLPAQQLRLELPRFRSPQWYDAQWKPQGDAPTIRVTTTDRNWLGTIREAEIFVGDELAYRLTRDNWRYAISNLEGKNLLERQGVPPRFYVTKDGDLLRRRSDFWGNKLTIIHPELGRLAEGRVVPGFLKFRLIIKILQPTEFDDELLAFMAFDMVEYLNER